MLIVNAIFLLVQLLFPLLNSWLGFKHQNLEKGQWSRTTRNQLLDSGVIGMLTRSRARKKGKWCESVQAVVSPSIVYTSYFFYSIPYICLFACFVSLCYLMCTSPYGVYYCIFFCNIFRLPQKWGPLEVLTSQRAQLKQTTLVVHPERPIQVLNISRLFGCRKKGCRCS
jgi:hypothetical protein